MIKTKFILSVCAISTIIGAANAATMCVKNDAVMVVLDPQVNGTGSYDETDKTWSMQFPYGVVSGVAGCNGSSSAAQTDIVQGAVVGTHCYCKMLRPIESLWVFYITTGGCSSRCTEFCTRGMSEVALRQVIFGSIGN